MVELSRGSKEQRRPEIHVKKLEMPENFALEFFKILNKFEI